MYISIHAVNDIPCWTSTLGVVGMLCHTMHVLGLYPMNHEQL